MSFMMAFGWASLMLCIGVLLRAKIPFFRNMLVPASVIGGLIGIIFINIMEAIDISIGTDFNMFTEIVNHLFTVSFISISLTSVPKDDGNAAKNTLKGALAIGLIWCFLYALTPLLGAGITALTGKSVEMLPIYGMLVQFGFCQGPGQAAAYGVLFEGFGWENASTVAITFAALGFVAAFFVGIPMAKAGIRRGLAKHCGQLNEALAKGYFKKEEQTETMVKDTTCNSNIETLAFHFALIGVCYMLAVVIAKLFALIPGFLGTSMSGMMFMNGMYAAYIVKFIIKKLKLDFLQENVLQSKITGWTSDYLVVCAFMAVSVKVISNWLVPIISVAVVTAVVTYFVCVYFGQRIGGKNDFERTLGLYGMATGTAPSGISLIRIVDPNFSTTTAVELGASNLTMTVCAPVYIVLLANASGALGLYPTLGALGACCVLYLVLLKVTKCWGTKTFSWKG